MRHPACRLGDGQCARSCHRVDVSGKCRPVRRKTFFRNPEQGREQARILARAISRGEPVGNLVGVPFALKDNFDIAGLPTTAGSRFWARNIAVADSAVAARLRRAGAILIGKLNMHEWAIGGTTQNPCLAHAITRGT